MRTCVLRIPAPGLGLVVMVGLATVAGCKGRELEKARVEARLAKATVTKLEVRLAKAVQEIDDTKNELNIVRQSRDELQRKVNQLTAERDKASGMAQRAQQMAADLSTRASGQANTTASLQQQVNELKALVEQQAATIKEQQGIIDVLQKGMVEMPTGMEQPIEGGEDEVPIVDPNESY
jgi:chromosome segregation ATPase